MTPRLRILLAGLGLILAGNAIALIGVAYNRSGEPDAVAELSERELGKAFNRNRDNSGLSLRLRWRVESETGIESMMLGGRMSGTTHWLDRDKLAELGFDTTEPQQNDARRPLPLPRAAWIVLELDGSVAQSWLAMREANLTKAEAELAENPEDKTLDQAARQARSVLSREREASRLFAIDAGLDRDALRQRYPDGSQYLILRGQVRSMYDDKKFSGYITELNGSTLHVSLADHAAIERSGKYTVTVAFGKRAEPWIIEARE